MSVTMVRPDGTTIEVPDESAGHLETVGYRRQTPEDELHQQFLEGQKEYYSTPGQQVATGLEGLASGATLGLADLVTGSDDAQERARYNPGIRLGTELLGGLATGESVLGPLAGEATAGIESPVLRGVARGALEGSAYGGGAAITNAKLSGDPLTAESVLAGMGWGALYGGGLGAGAGAFESAGARAERAAGEIDRASVAASVPSEAYGAFRGAVNDAQRLSTDALDEAQAAVKRVETVSPDLEAPAQEHLSAMDTGSKEAVNAAISAKAMRLPGATQLKKSIFSALGDARAAMGAGDLEAFEEAARAHERAIREFTTATGVKLPQALRGKAFSLGDLAQGVAGPAFEELGQLAAAGKQLQGLAMTPEGFLQMSPAKVERIAGAVDTFLGGKAAELGGAREGLKAAIGTMVAETGVKVEGSVGQQLRAAHEALRFAASSAGKRSGGFLAGLEKYSAGRAAEWAAGKAGAPWGVRQLTYFAGSRAMGGLLGLKGAVLKRLTDAASKWAPRAAGAARRIAPRAEPLKTRLDGTIDEANKPRHRLMEERAQEIRDAAPGIHETLYRAVAPFNLAHGDFAAALHQLSIEQFQAMTEHLPRDPGLAFSGMRSLWKADPVETEKFARAWEVLHNPVAVAVRALETGDITPEAAHALRTYNPQLFMEMKSAWLSSMTPERMSAMPYQDQIRMGTLMDMVIHSTADPRFITQQQMMYLKRTKPLESKPLVPGMGEQGGRPSPGPGASAAQKITEH